MTKMKLKRIWHQTRPPHNKINQQTESTTYSINKFLSNITYDSSTPCGKRQNIRQNQLLKYHQKAEAITEVPSENETKHGHAVTAIKQISLLNILKEYSSVLLLLC